MSLTDAIFLGIIQGISEFLPISSSGHLILTEKILHLDVNALKSFDISVHFGTLLALLTYFHKDILDLLRTACLIMKKVIHREGNTTLGEKVNPQNAKLIAYIVAGTIPAVIIGYFLGDFLDLYFRNPVTVSLFLIGVGFLFPVIEYIHKRMKTSEITMNKAIVIGVAQALALIPGVSRSGATICAGLAQGIKREDSARFSFLLGAVAITAATALAIYEVKKGVLSLPGLDLTIAGIISSFTAGFLSISFLMKYLKNHTLNAFAFYRILLGLIILSSGF